MSTVIKTYNMKKTLLLLLVIIWSWSYIKADVIVTTNNQRIVCKIVRSDNKYVYYQIDGSGILKIHNDNIVSISVSDNDTNSNITPNNSTNQNIPNDYINESKTTRTRDRFSWNPSGEKAHFQGKINGSITMLNIGVGTSLELGSRIRDFIYIGGGVGFEYRNLWLYYHTFSMPVFVPIHFYIPISVKVKPMIELTNGFTMFWMKYRYHEEDVPSFGVGYYLRFGTGVEIANKHAITGGLEINGLIGGYLNYSYSF